MAEESDDPCEGCGAPATTSDSEGIALCNECFQACMDDPGCHVNDGELEPALRSSAELGAVSGSAPAQPRVVTSCFDGCGSSHLSETNNYYVCRSCGMTYSKNKAAVTQGPNEKLTDPTKLNRGNESKP